jgi:hypothetical protein
MCWRCKCTKNAVPKGGVTIECDGYKETLEDSASDDEEGDEYCKCDEPRFKEKLEFCEKAIDGWNHSDYCYKIIELSVQDSIQVDDDDDKPQKATKMSKA